MYLHTDKTVLSLPGTSHDPEYEDFEKVTLPQICALISGRLDGRVKDHTPIKQKSNDYFYLYRRFKRIRHSEGLIDFFHDRIWEVRPYIRNMASARITWENKLDYSNHRQIQLIVEQFLSYYSLPFHLSEAEVALDTLDESKGKALRLFGCPARWKSDNRLQVIESPYGDVSYYKGCNKGGNNQYYNFWTHNRQWHFYEKQAQGNTIYRAEFIARREYLLRQGIQTHNDLFPQCESLMRENLSLKVPCFENVEADYDKFGKQGLHPKFTAEPFSVYENLIGYPSPEWIFVLQQRLDMSRQEIVRRYFSDLPFPEVNLY